MCVSRYTAYTTYIHLNAGCGSMGTCLSKEYTFTASFHGHRTSHPAAGSYIYVYNISIITYIYIRTTILSAPPRDYVNVLKIKQYCLMINLHKAIITRQTARKVSKPKRGPVCVWARENIKESFSLAHRPRAQIRRAMEQPALHLWIPLRASLSREFALIKKKKPSYYRFTTVLLGI